MTYISWSIICFLWIAHYALAQEPSDSNAIATTHLLQEVVVTGQYEPQSLRQSVYQIRIINRERIQLRAATNLAGVLNTELGIHFANDLALGTSDIQMMGMAGRNVKILLDGVPLLDRGDTRESLNQIDINTIERIEIVEGPLSISYGSDALAGVINIITKKNLIEGLTISARIQEETVGNTYRAFSSKGVHNQNLGISWQKSRWYTTLGSSHNYFGGWQGQSTGRVNDWKPKEQWLGNATFGYKTAAFNGWYRLDALNEQIESNGLVNPNTNQARDQQYITNRFTHQAQADWRINNRWHLNGIASYTNYNRRTQTTNLDLKTGRRTLSLGDGEQDLSHFDSQVVRITAQYKISSMVSLQSGIDLQSENTTGPRILGTPTIRDYAFFISSELKPSTAITIRPGLRFIKNSVYDAPPIIPSLSTKIRLTKKWDLRIAYARGFRSPALRELYFNFFDASHSITGNPNLKAEYSNSFNGSLTWQSVNTTAIRINSTLTTFYNSFHNLINYGFDPTNPSLTQTINVDRFKTTGGTLTNSIYSTNWQITLGFSSIGRYNSLAEDHTNLPEFAWSPEFNSTILYGFSKSGTKLYLSYKYTGKRPSYEATINEKGTTRIHLAKIAAYHLADFTINQTISRFITLNGGIKNLFDITRLANTSSVDVNDAHGTGGQVPLSYGRSYFLGLTLQWAKNNHLSN